MRLKKIVSGILACAMVVTSVFVGDVTTVKADVTLPDPIAKYDFNEALADNVEVFDKGLTTYSGTVSESDYVTGRSGADEDRALKLGKFGLRLPEKNIGKAYTVSMWVNRTGDLTNFMPIMFLGRDANGGWICAAGAWGNANRAILWGGNNADSILSADEASFDLEKEQWVMLTITQKDNTVSIYKNGALIKNITTKLNALDGEEQRIHLGVNPYSADGVFPGLVDDVYIYNQALTARQVRFLYDNKTDADILNEEGITATSQLNIYKGLTRKINVTLPSAIAEEGITLAYTSADDSVATVSGDGKVTGVKEGSTTVTVTASMGSVSKTATTKITVSEVPEGLDPEVAAEYIFSIAEDGKLKDVSGHGNDATIQGNNITFKPVASPDEPGEMTVGADSYLELPLGIMDSLDDQEAFTIETTFAKSKDCGENAWLFCLGSKVQGTGTNYMFLSPNYGKTTLRAGIKNSSSEKLFATSIQPVVDQWYTVNMVFNHGTVKLYWNGILINGTNGDKLESGYSIMNDVVNPGTENGILGYIGKSCWSNDKTFQGKISSFKIYNMAMTDEEVQLSRPEYLETLQKTLDEGLDVYDILGVNTSPDEIRHNLQLPSNLGETALVWETKNKNIISEKGVVKNGTSDQEVTITALLKSGALEAKKEFNLTVKALDISKLQARITEAQNMLAGTEELDEAVQAALNKDGVTNAIEQANAAITTSSQTEVDSADKALEKAMDNLYPASWTDPFASINDSKAGETVTMVPGTEDTLTAIPDKVKPFVTVSYTASHPDIADVDESTGVVTAKKAGYSKITTTVTAKSDDFEMEYQTLVKVDFDFSEVSAEAEKSSIAAGETTGIKVTLPEGLNLTPTLSGQAENAFVSVEEKDGKVTITGVAEGTGSVTIIVRAGGKMKAFQIPVEVTKGSASTEPDLSGVTASAAAASIVQGSTTKINVKYPANVQAANPVASYKASGAVSVDTNGTVTGNSVGEGTVVVTVTVGSKSRELPSIKITVTKKQDDNQGGQEDTTVDISKAKIKAKATKIAKGKTTTISITYPNTATKAAAKVTYKASGAVSVSKAGKVKGKKAGKGTVTVTIKASGQKTVTKKITVNVGDINGKSSVKVKKSITLKVKGISGKVKWSVNKKKLASISSKGKLKAKKAGKVKVTAKVGKVTMTKTITIKK